VQKPSPRFASATIPGDNPAKEANQEDLSAIRQAVWQNNLSSKQQHFLTSNICYISGKPSTGREFLQMLDQLIETGVSRTKTVIKLANGELLEDARALGFLSSDESTVKLTQAGLKAAYPKA
jgi:hypothetical protein